LISKAVGLVKPPNLRPELNTWPIAALAAENTFPHMLRFMFDEGIAVCSVDPPLVQWSFFLSGNTICK